MRPLFQVLLESFDNQLKLSEKDKELLIKYDKEFDVIADEFEKEHNHFANITNVKDAIDGVLHAIEKGDTKYVPDIKYEDSKLSDDEWCEDFIKRINDLKLRFVDLRCYLTKFYVYRINKIIEHVMFLNKYTKDHSYRGEVSNHPSKRLYDIAVEMIKENKFVDADELAEKDPDYAHNIPAEEAKPILQKEIDRLGYEWKVVVDDNLVPRMGVRKYQEFCINGRKKFSKVDIDSLKVHEVAVHVARKYHALQSGLYLFLHGLKGNDVYDEGIAIYNSLNKVEKPKPNIIFYICVKIILLYEMHKGNIIDAYKKVKELTGIDDNRIAYAIIRASRVQIYTSLGNYSSDEDYLDGYIRVKDMTEEERKKLLTLPIGPDQLFELDTLLKFIKINKFEPIKPRKIK